MTEEQRFDIKEYITRFPESLQEIAMKEIFVGELLKKVFQTSEGKAILSGAVDLITAKVGQILALADKGFDKNKEDIKQACLEVKIARQQMTMWAEALTKREIHEEQARKLKR